MTVSVITGRETPSGRQRSKTAPGRNPGGGFGLWLWSRQRLGTLPSIWLIGAGLGGLRRETQPGGAHAVPNEL
jgi:hypothetical protein